MYPIFTIFDHCHEFLHFHVLRIALRFGCDQNFTCMANLIKTQTFPRPTYHAHNLGTVDRLLHVHHILPRRHVDEYVSSTFSFAYDFTLKPPKGFQLELSL